MKAETADIRQLTDEEIDGIDKDSQIDSYTIAVLIDDFVAIRNQAKEANRLRAALAEACHGWWLEGGATQPAKATRIQELAAMSKDHKEGST